MKNSLIIAAVICIIYSLFLEYGSKPSIVITQSQWQNNQYSTEKYLRASKNEATQYGVVFVGSSLSDRLDFDEMSKCVYNLALSGDSALTGLSVIANSEARPRLVFIEINVPQRDSNQELINRGMGFFAQRLPMFYIENMPINLALSFRAKLKNKEPQKEPNEPVRLNALAMQIKNHQFPVSSNKLNKGMSEFGRLVKTIEAKGAKAIFFEMPIHPDLENTPLAVQIRNAFKNFFPKHKLLSFSELAGGREIKTADGLHLSNEEAKIVVGNMKGYFDHVCANPNAGIHPRT